jgi:hypothetical protein
MLAIPSDPEQIIQNGRNSIGVANVASAPDVSKIYQNLPHQHVPVGDPVQQSQVYVSKKSKSSKKHSGNGQGKQSSVCPYHLKNYVAFCSIHNELVCEECCDLSHHRDHNNQILLLKAAAQNFI